MRLNPYGIEPYDPGPATDPTVDAADWLASFDDTAPSIPAVVVNSRPTWLVAHPTVTDPDDGVTVLPDVEWLIPAIGFTDGGELIIRDGPPIYLT